MLLKFKLFLQVWGKCVSLDTPSKLVGKQTLKNKKSVTIYYKCQQLFPLIVMVAMDGFVNW